MCKIALIMADMSESKYIADLESDAMSVGLSVDQLCAEANVARSTFTRWKAGVTQPNLSTYQKFTKVIDRFRKKAPPGTKPASKQRATKGSQ